MKLTKLCVPILLVSICFAMPVSQSAANTPQSEVPIWNQISGNATSSHGVDCSSNKALSTQSTVSLSAGQSYYYIGGVIRTAGANSFFTMLGDAADPTGNNRIIAIGQPGLVLPQNQFPAFTQTIPADLIQMVNNSANQYWVVMRFTMPASTSGYWICISSDANAAKDLQGWTVPGTINQLTGALTDVGGATVGWILNANTTTSIPVAPVISGSTQCAVSPYTNVLTWPAVSGALGYNLTINGAPSIPLGNVLTYTDTATFTNKTYSLIAFNGNGNGPSSNNLTLKCPTIPLGQAMSGGDSGQTLATGMFGNSALASVALVIWGIIFTLFVGVALGATLGSGAGIGGAILAIVLSYAFGWFPLWVLLFLVIVAGGGTVLWARYRSGGEA